MTATVETHLIPMPRTRAGTVLPLPDDIYWKKVEARLVAYSRRSGSCLLWTGRITYSGYGHISVRDRIHNAHRIAYQVWVGEIPEGLEIDHLCRVRNCIEPTHLEAVTHAENVRRTAERKTHCGRGHAYAEHGFRNRRGHRQCRQCRREDRRAWRAKQKERAS